MGFNSGFKGLTAFYSWQGQQIFILFVIVITGSGAKTASCWVGNFEFFFPPELKRAGHGAKLSFKNEINFYATSKKSGWNEEEINFLLLLFYWLSSQT